MYLHVGILYEAAVWIAWRRGFLTDARGPVWMWLLIGAGVVAIVVGGLWLCRPDPWLRPPGRHSLALLASWLAWFWRSVWFPRLIWAMHAFRVPFLMEGAFLAPPEQRLSPAFYHTALVVVIINLWMLARAGWDL